MDIELLVSEAKQGSKDALVRLIMGQKNEYYKLAFVYMKNSEDAMDAMEDMIVSIYENIHKLKKDEAFYSWSKTILVNRCKTLLKKKEVIVSLDNVKEEAYASTDSTDYSDSTDSHVLLDYHLSRLEYKYQEILRLRYYLDMDYQSIADVLKIPLGTVKSRIYSGIRMLKECFGGEQNEGC